MTDSAGYWYCGKMVAEPVIIGNRVSRYEYRVRKGCGKLNPPGTEKCADCGREKICVPRVEEDTSKSMYS